jgi:hypothetical protein
MLAVAVVVAILLLVLLVLVVLVVEEMEGFQLQPKAVQPTQAGVAGRLAALEIILAQAALALSSSSILLHKQEY